MILTNYRSTYKGIIVGIGITIVFISAQLVRDPLATSIELLKRYVNEFTPEKIYIATDKPFYIAGEILWYKAWLVNGVDHKPDSPSQTMYAELVSPSGDVVLSKVLKSINGGVAGDFFLPESLTPGEYTLRAYTSWMQNFDESWFFRRTIRILRPGDAAPQAYLDVHQVVDADSLRFQWVLVNEEGKPVTGTDVDLTLMSGRDRLDRTKVKSDDNGRIGWVTKVNHTAELEIPVVDVAYRVGRNRVNFSLQVPELAAPQIHFMPEGGELIAGIEQRVAFKVTDGSGRGLAVRGRLLDADGTEILSFADEYRGMGSFSFIPEAGVTYKAEVNTDLRSLGIVDLPVVNDAGIALSAVISDPESIVLQIVARNIASDITLIGHTRGEIVFSGSAAASSDGFIARIPYNQLPAGITHFTIFDAEGVPRAERLVFQPPFSEGEIQLITDSEVYRKRSEVNLDIAYLDSESNPIAANFAVSVTRDDEANYDFENRSDIQSYLLLTSDLKGLIETPSYYMSNDPTVQHHADLLMMTQGWRRFNWNAMLSGQFPEITNFVEEGIVISGTYIQRNNRKVIKNEEIMLAINPDNPSYQSVTTDDDGRFILEGMDIADSTVVMLQGDDKDGRRPIDFTTNPLYTPHRDVQWQPTLPAIDLASIDRAYTGNARNRLATDRAYGLQNDVRELGEIIVEAKAEPAQMNMSDINRSYGAPDRTYEPSYSDQSRGGNALDFLRGRTGAFRISGSGAGTRVVSSRAASINLSTQPLFLLDGVEVDLGAILRISIQDVAAVDILTEVSSTVMFGSRGSNGVISVFTRKGPPAEIPKTNTITRRVPGYYEVREFYAPNYTFRKDLHRKPDSRSTLWWDHTVVPDDSGLARISFFTSDDTGVFRIRVEGIDTFGLPLVKESTFRVE